MARILIIQLTRKMVSQKFIINEMLILIIKIVLYFDILEFMELIFVD